MSKALMDRSDSWLVNVQFASFVNTIFHKDHHFLKIKLSHLMWMLTLPMPKTTDYTGERGYLHIVLSVYRLDPPADRLPVLFSPKEDFNVCQHLLHLWFCSGYFELRFVCQCVSGVFDAGLLLWWFTAKLLRPGPRARSISTGPLHGRG